MNVTLPGEIELLGAIGLSTDAFKLDTSLAVGSQAGELNADKQKEVKSDPTKVNTATRKNWWDGFKSSPIQAVSSFFGISSFSTGAWSVSSTGSGFSVAKGSGSSATTPAGSGLMQSLKSVPWYIYAAGAGAIVLIGASRRR